LKLGFNSQLSYNEQDVTPTMGYNVPQYGNVFFSYPLNPVYFENGDMYLNYNVPYSGINPVAANNLNSSHNSSYRAFNKFSLDVDLAKNFKFSTYLGVDFALSESKDKADPRLADNGVTGVGKIVDGDIRIRNITSNTM